MRVNTALDLAAAIKGRRKELRLTQAALAKSAGVARSWLAMVESGKTSVEFGLILRVLDALELRIEVLPAQLDVGTIFQGTLDTRLRDVGDVVKESPVDLDRLIDRHTDR